MKISIRTVLAVFLCVSAVFTSCSSTKRIALNSISDMLSGADKNGKTLSSDSDAMLALTGETDVELVEDFFPTALKLYEILHYQNPEHAGLAVMSGSLYVMYANVFIQNNASQMTNIDAQMNEYNRAKMFYLRGRDYILEIFERKYPGFQTALLSADSDLYNEALLQLKKEDVNAAYWAGAGWLGAFSVDNYDNDLLHSCTAAVALLEKAAELDPEYSSGAIWDILSMFYYAAPYDFGGDPERALFCHEESMRLSEGKSPGPYVTYAETFCLKDQNLSGYIEALQSALAIDPDDNPETRLATIISQNKARRMMSQQYIDEHFIIWEDDMAVYEELFR